MVVIAGRNVESLKAVVNEITQLGGKVRRCIWSDRKYL